KGRTVLITGASRNIGRHTAVLFAREGANLAICTRRSMERLNRTRWRAISPDSATL
ncbi:MAG: SDR family NAD(P)-dependent oxidoreductase, partial [Desulfobacterales bacterium]|nr:SDR family NAD(P)-dependent oxidoreductase [Desulfobacterales bacterium]